MNETEQANIQGGQISTEDQQKLQALIDHITAPGKKVGAGANKIGSLAK